MLDHHIKDRSHHLQKHRTQRLPGVLRFVDFGPSHIGLANGRAVTHGRRRHPDVDTKFRYGWRPIFLPQINLGQFARKAKVTADRLTDPAAVDTTRHGISNVVRNGAVILVAHIKGCNKPKVFK